MILASGSNPDVIHLSDITDVTDPRTNPDSKVLFYIPQVPTPVELVAKGC